MESENQVPEIRAEAMEYDPLEAENTAEVLLGRMMTYTGIQAALKQRHGINGRTARSLIKRVRERWGEEEPTDKRRERRSQLRAAGEDLYRVGMERDEPNLCLKCLDFLAKLDGLSGDISSGLNKKELAIDGEANELRIRLEAWLENLPMEKRQEVIQQLHAAESAVRGATSAFLLNQDLKSEEQHEQATECDGGDAELPTSPE